jgi:uncharacterized OsmC-like protein
MTDNTPGLAYLVAMSLRDLQAPLKERYRAEPETARVTLRAVAASIGIDVRSGTVRAEADLDFRGTLAVDKAAPVGFSDLRLSFDLDTDATDDELATLLRLTERYCAVLQTITRPPAHSSTVRTV